MKKWLVLLLLAAGAAALGFWVSKKACTMACAPMTAAAMPKLPAEVMDLEKSFQAEAHGICMQICAARAEMLRLVEQQPADQAAIDRAISSIAAFQARLDRRVADHLLSVQRALGPGEFAQYMRRIKRNFTSCVSSPS